MRVMLEHSGISAIAVLVRDDGHTLFIHKPIDVRGQPAEAQADAICEAVSSALRESAADTGLSPWDIDKLQQAIGRLNS